MNVSREIHMKDYLIAGTDPDIIALYEDLPSRTKDLQFSLIEDEIVVLDTETTGLSATACSLIEIAALRMRGNEIVDEFHTFVNPGKNIPSEITELTGITQDDVSGAPSPGDAVAQLAEFAGTCNLIAHNANFDRDFIMRKASPGAFPGDWVDSLAFSQIVLPRFKTHRLIDLALAFGLSLPTHSAMDDTRALAELWRILLAAALSMAPGLAGRIAELSPETGWPLRQYFAQAALQYPGVDFSLRRNRADCVCATALVQRPDSDELALEFSDCASIDETFSSDGIVGAIYPQYEQRVEQLGMATEVVEALQEGDIRVIEAGTGVGKSMAYLVPLALAAQENNITVGVATKTNALMDQLVYQELPRLHEAMENLKYVALKGYEHYLCLRKLDGLMRSTADNCESINKIAALMSFTAQTPQDDLDAINLNLTTISRLNVRANSHDCLKKRCPFFPRLCYLHGARKAATGADIVVTNHALLFRDMQTDNGILPPIRHWVIDEAHSVEDEARQQLSCGISSRELDQTLARLTAHKTGIISRAQKQANKLEGGAMLYGVAADIEDRVGQIKNTSAVFFEHIKDLASEKSSSTAGYNKETLWISAEIREKKTWKELQTPGLHLSELLSGLTKRIADLVSMLEQFEGEFTNQIAELSTIQSDLRNGLEALKLILNGTDIRFVYAMQVEDNGRFSSQTLEALRLDVGESLIADFYPNASSLVFASATLSTADKEPYAHFMRAVGLDRVKDKSVRAATFASSYDYEHNMTIFLPSDIPEPSASGYHEEFARLLYEVHAAMGGSVLTLFTNRREMESFYHELKPQLADIDIDLVAQTRGISTKSLRDKFVSDKNLSMFALKSFWEGFDAPGDTLRCVIIARLPFSRPDDPVACEREVREGRVAWRRYSLPEAVMDLKQAAGRLIRNSTDYGWLILADARLQTKNYASSFLRAMPTTDIRTASTKDIARIIENQSPGHI